MPLHDAWKEEGHLAYGQIFCDVFDKALVRGFNEALEIQIPITMVEGANRCEFVFDDPDIKETDQILVKLRNKRLGKNATKPMHYHTGHLYQFMKKSLTDSYPAEVQQLFDAIHVSYTDVFGREALDIILSYENHDFDSIADYQHHQ